MAGGGDRKNMADREAHNERVKLRGNYIKYVWQKKKKEFNRERAI